MLFIDEHDTFSALALLPHFDLRARGGSYQPQGSTYGASSRLAIWQFLTPSLLKVGISGNSNHSLTGCVILSLIANRPPVLLSVGIG